MLTFRILTPRGALTRTIWVGALLCALIFPVVMSGQDSKSSVVDMALVFAGSEDGPLSLKQLEGELAEATLETGAVLVFRTESTAIGSTAHLLAEKYVAEMLDGSKPGAVMVHVRADDSVGVARTEASSEIPGYIFATVEKPTGARPSNLDLPEYALRSGRELIAVFTKFYGSDTGKNDPRKKADKILMGCVFVGAIFLVFGFALIKWRGDRKAAGA